MARSAKMGALKDLADMLLPDLLEDFEDEKKKKKKEDEKEVPENVESENDKNIPFEGIESTESKPRIVDFSLTKIMANRPSSKKQKGKRSKKS